MTNQWLRWVRPVGIAIALALLGWAIGGATWRDDAGRLTANVCIPIASAVAAFSIGLAATTPYLGAAGWFAAAIIGQATALQLIEAGTAIRYQHYPPIDVMLRSHPWLLATIATQAGIVLIGLAAQVATVPLTPSRELVPGWAPPVGPVAVGVHRRDGFTVDAVLTELLFAAGVKPRIATVAMMVLSLPAAPAGSIGRALDRVLGDDSSEVAPSTIWRDPFPWIAALAATCVAAALSLFSYERHPHIPDEVAYLIHARYFAEGMLTMPIPPVAAAFDVGLFIYEPTRWFSSVPPGWPAVLAIGVLAGVPWLVNPVLTGLCVLLTHALFGHLYSRRTTRYATALLAASPWFLFLGMSLMTHILTLACVLVAAVGVVHARRTGRFAWGALAGMGVGAITVRPLDGFVVGLLIAAWSFGLAARASDSRPWPVWVSALSWPRRRFCPTTRRSRAIP
jgi:hypothetical protein